MRSVYVWCVVWSGGKVAGGRDPGRKQRVLGRSVGVRTQKKGTGPGKRYAAGAGCAVGHV